MVGRSLGNGSGECLREHYREPYPREKQDWELELDQEVNLVSKALRSISACFAHFYRRVPIRYCRHDCARPDLSCFRNEYAVSTCSFIEYSLQESSGSCKWSLLPAACTIMSHCTEETRREAIICLRLNRKQVWDPGLENRVCVIATVDSISQLKKGSGKILETPKT